MDSSFLNLPIFIKYICSVLSLKDQNTISEEDEIEGKSRERYFGQEIEKEKEKDCQEVAYESANESSGENRD